MLVARVFVLNTMLVPILKTIKLTMWPSTASQSTKSTKPSKNLPFLGHACKCSTETVMYRRWLQFSRVFTLSKQSERFVVLHLTIYVVYLLYKMKKHIHSSCLPYICQANSWMIIKCLKKYRKGCIYGVKISNISVALISTSSSR